MSLRRTALLAVALGILVTPALALPHTGAFHKSSEVFANDMLGTALTAGCGWAQ